MPASPLMDPAPWAADGLSNEAGKPIIAIIYSDSEAADEALRSIALRLLDRGCRLAGLVQHNRPRPGRSRCDMVLEELASGDLVPISQDRGPEAKGCALVLDQLLKAMQIVRAALPTRPDLVIVNKFGKTEAEGGGFRTLIAEAMELAIPVLVAVPFRNIDQWHAFAGPCAREIELQSSEHTVEMVCAVVLRDRPCRVEPYDRRDQAPKVQKDAEAM